MKLRGILREIDGFVMDTVERNLIEDQRGSECLQSTSNRSLSHLARGALSVERNRATDGSISNTSGAAVAVDVAESLESERKTSAPTANTRSLSLNREMA